jgi:hypothetical protein
MTECKKRSDWDKWKVANETEIALLYKKEVFSVVMPTPCDIFSMGYNGFSSVKEMKTTKLWDIKQGLWHKVLRKRPGVDFNETYSS